MPCACAALQASVIAVCRSPCGRTVKPTWAPERPDDPVETRAGQPARPFARPVKVGKHRPWMPTPHRQPRPQRRLGGLRQGQDVLLPPAFAQDRHSPSRQVHIRHVQSHDFAAAQSQVIEQPQRGPIALRFRIAPRLQGLQHGADSRLSWPRGVPVGLRLDVLDLQRPGHAADRCPANCTRERSVARRRLTVVACRPRSSRCA